MDLIYTLLPFKLPAYRRRRTADDGPPKVFDSVVCSRSSTVSSYNSTQVALEGNEGYEYPPP